MQPLNNKPNLTLPAERRKPAKLWCSAAWLAAAAAAAAALQHAAWQGSKELLLALDLVQPPPRFSAVPAGRAVPKRARRASWS